MPAAQVIAEGAYGLFGSITWHLQHGSYKPVTGPGFAACRAALPWWHVFPAAGAPGVAAVQAQ